MDQMKGSSEIKTKTVFAKLNAGFMLLCSSDGKGHANHRSDNINWLLERQRYENVFDITVILLLISRNINT